MIFAAMPLITISTHIQAPIESCFDFSRSIDLHVESMVGTQEEAVAAVHPLDAAT